MASARCSNAGLLFASVASSQQGHPRGGGRRAEIRQRQEVQPPPVSEAPQESNEVGRHLACGAASAVASRTLIAPLERVKMEVLLNPSKALSWRHAAMMIFKDGGVLGFWKGNLLNCVRTAPFRAINYFAFATYNRHLHERASKQLRGMERFVAGAGAGITATLTCFPLDVIRTRMMAPSNPHNVVDTIVRMLRHEGVGAFYTGCVPAVVSMAIGGAIFYGVYDLLKSQDLRSRGLDPYEVQRGQHQMQMSVGTTLLFGAISGMVAECVTYPFEVIRRKMQLSSLLAAQRIPLTAPGQAVPMAARISIATRVVAAFRLAVKQHGLRGLYSGMAPNMLQVLPNSALAYFVYESMKVLLDVRG